VIFIHSFIGTKEGFSENNLSSCLRPLCSLLTRQITNKKAREEKGGICRVKKETMFWTINIFFWLSDIGRKND
jgi:hypothetical protein